MAGTVTVVIHAALSTVTVTVVLGALVDTITGTDVVISVQTGIRSVTDLTGVMQRIPDIAVSYCMNSLASQLISCIYRNCPLPLHRFSRRNVKNSCFSPPWANNKNKDLVKRLHIRVNNGSLWGFPLKEKLTWSFAFLCRHRERVVPADSAGDRKHVWMCGCSRNVFAPSGPCVHVTWNVVANGCVCLCSARVAMSDEQTHAHTHVVWKPLGYALFLTCSIMIYNFPNSRLWLVLVVQLITTRMAVLHNFDSSCFSLCGSVK